MKPADVVARRCVCLELLAQRLALETDAESPLADRESARVMWVSRESDLGIAEEWLPEERALLEKPVGALTEDDLDDVEGRASGAPVLLWALGRIAVRPSFATALDEVLAEHGLLGDGSIAAAKAAIDEAETQDNAALEEALGAYRRTRGKSREANDPEKVFAEVAAHHLTWVIDDEMSFEDDA